MKTIRLGTRSSRLALWQACWVRDELVRKGVPVEIVPITTSGDRTQAGPIENIGAQGVFTKEIQRALLRNEIDLAVHSLKDLPTEPIDGLILAAIPKREDYRDVFVSSRFSSLADLPNDAKIGTGSLRRQTQLRYILQRRFEKTANVENIRGNVETRLRKLDDENFDAIILAAAGLKRLGFADRITDYLPIPLFLPAVGQGALGLETRIDDSETIRELESIENWSAHLAVLAERSFLLTLEGGCIAPIAALGTLTNDDVSFAEIQEIPPCFLDSLFNSNDSANLTEATSKKSTKEAETDFKLQGRILSLDGERMFEASRSIRLNSSSLRNQTSSLVDFLSSDVKFVAEKLGRDIADALLADGADEIVAEIKQRRQTR